MERAHARKVIRQDVMAEGSRIAHDLAQIAELACGKLIDHFKKMPDEAFFREFDGLEESDLFIDVPTDLEWMQARFRTVSNKSASLHPQCSGQ